MALVALTMALTEAAPLGWGHGMVRGGFLFAIAATLGFIWIEARSHSPMLPLALFRVPTFTVASVAGVVVNFAYYGLIFVFSLLFQIQQQLSPQLTGLAFLPMTVVLMAVNVLAGRLITRMGARALMVLGLTLAAFGYLLLMPVSVNGSYWLLVVPMLLAASGTALMVPTMTNATLSSVDASRAGIASGVLNSARQVGGMLGVAVFGYLVKTPHRTPSCAACICRSALPWRFFCLAVCCAGSACRRIVLRHDEVKTSDFGICAAFWPLPKNGH